MQTINIFIASSCELSEQRVLIGDYIRRLSYDYSPRGVRLRLACWEDFSPEYKGTSKQQEYDEKLIKSCDIFIALFRTRCGIYTQHEVKLALDLNKECHILQLPSTDYHNDLDKFLSSIELVPLQCDDTLLLEKIGNIVDNHMSTHQISLSSIATPLNTWRLYATIPDDLEDLRIGFSNMVRSLENNLEETLGCYFSLYPYRTPDNIVSAEHYLCFIKDSWSQSDELEVEKAYECCRNSSIPDTILYQFEGSKGVKNNLLAEKINSKYEAFPKSYSHIDTIKSDLFFWALRHKMELSFDAVQAFRVEGDVLYCYGRPFFNLSVYPRLYSSIVSITRTIANIDEKIRRNMKEGSVKNETIAIDLAKKRHNQEMQLQSTINNWYNKIQLLENLNFGTRKSQIEALKSDQFTQYAELSEEIKHKTIKCNNADKLFLRDFAAKLLEWENIAGMNLSMNMIHVSEYIQVLNHIVKVCDTYLHPSGIYFDEDAIFKKIIDTADQYNYHTLFTEVMRVNYANSFSSDLHHDITGEYYRNAYAHIIKIEDESILAHRYKSYVIKSLLQYFDEIDDKQAVFELGGYYEELILQWQNTNIHANYDVDLARCYSFMLAAAPKYYGACKELAEKSEILIKRLHKQFDRKPYDPDYFDALCYFNIVLSAYFIDRYEDGNIDYYEKALHYIKESQKSLHACYPFNPLYVSFSLSQPLHNRGFLYSKVNNWKGAISNYKSALKKREDLYYKDMSDRTLFEVAQTLVNLGDAYCNLNKFDKALEYADRAVSIYKIKLEKEMSVFDMYYYEAYQLKATILLSIEKEKGNYPQEALNMLQECLDWSNKHPYNDYKDRFDDVSGVILDSYKNKD